MKKWFKRKVLSLFGVCIKRTIKRDGGEWGSEKMNSFIEKVALSQASTKAPLLLTLAFVTPVSVIVSAILATHRVYFPEQFDPVFSLALLYLASVGVGIPVVVEARSIIWNRGWAVYHLLPRLPGLSIQTFLELVTIPEEEEVRKLASLEGRDLRLKRLGNSRPPFTLSDLVASAMSDDAEMIIVSPPSSVFFVLNGVMHFQPMFELQENERDSFLLHLAEECGVDTGRHWSGLGGLKSGVTYEDLGINIVVFFGKDNEEGGDGVGEVYISFSSKGDEHDGK